MVVLSLYRHAILIQSYRLFFGNIVALAEQVHFSDNYLVLVLMLCALQIVCNYSQ